MISNKDAKTYLIKDNLYKVSKEDIKSFQNIFIYSPVLYKYIYKDKDVFEENLKKQVFYINNVTCNKLYDIFKKSLKEKDFSHPYIYFTFFTLKDAINRSDIIPTIFYYDEEDYEIKGNQIKINLEDFILSFKTIEVITNKISSFVKNIRPDVHFKTKTKKFVAEPIPKSKPDLIPKSKPKTKSKPDLIHKSKPKTKSKPDLIPKSKPKTIDDNISKDPYNQFNPKTVKALVKEINNPLTKDILGIKISNKKINNLTTEEAIVLTWIIRALIKN